MARGGISASSSVMNAGVEVTDTLAKPRTGRLAPAAAPPVDPQIAAIVAARPGDPFAFLGMHETGDGLVVRAMLPGAETVEVIDVATGAVAGESARVHPDGVFVARFSSRKE